MTNKQISYRPMHPYQRLLAAAALGVACAVTAKADPPFSMSLIPPDTQIVHADKSVAGMRINLYGQNEYMKGFDVGLANETTADFRGFGVGLVNLVGGDMHGVQWSPVGYARIEGSAQGWHSGLVGHVNGNMEGLQDGVVAITDQDFSGVQGGILWNQTGGAMSGLQLGLVNRAGAASGLQLGLVNLARDMKGLQIGLWNQIDSKERLKVFPIVNWKF